MSTYLKCLQRESSSEVSMSILWVLLEDEVEISDCFLVPVYHLVSFGPLVHVSHIGRQPLDALRIWEYGFFELLLAAVGKSHCVVDVWLICQEGPILE